MYLLTYLNEDCAKEVERDMTLSRADAATGPQSPAFSEIADGVSRTEAAGRSGFPARVGRDAGRTAAATEVRRE